MWGVLSSGGLKENKEDWENIYSAVPQWQALVFSTLTTEFLPQSHNVADTIIPFYRWGIGKFREAKNEYISRLYG